MFWFYFRLDSTSSDVKDVKIENRIPDELNQTAMTTENNSISITTDRDFKSTEDYNDAYLGIDILGPYKQQNEAYESSDVDLNTTSSYESNANNISFEQIYEVLFANQNNASISLVESTTSQTTEQLNTTMSTMLTNTTPKAPSKNLTSNAIPLKLITILNNTKKESPTKIEIPQRKNNKIIDPTDEPLLDDTNMPLTTTEMPSSTKSNAQKSENPIILRDMFLSNKNRPSIGNGDSSDDSLHKSPIFLTRPINKLSPSFISTASFPGLNSIESKHNFQKNPIRSELDLIITELNKNKQTNDFSHTNNFSSENYQVLHADETNIANTESYVVNNGETKIFTPPHKDPAGLLKLAGCNIYGRMYRVGRIIAELSSSCLECRCTEVGVSCTPLNC